MNIRTARIEDTDEIVELMKQLGYPVSQELIEQKLHDFESRSYDQVFVAEIESEMIGVISCHITSLFHQDGASGRITSLVVGREFKRGGIGRALVQKAEEYFLSNRCVKSEVTSGVQRKAAHSFYEACGYNEDERRFLKIYS